MKNGLHLKLCSSQRQTEIKIHLLIIKITTDWLYDENNGCLCQGIYHGLALIDSIAHNRVTQGKASVRLLACLNGVDDLLWAHKGDTIVMLIWSSLGEYCNLSHNLFNT